MKVSHCLHNDENASFVDAAESKSKTSELTTNQISSIKEGSQALEVIFKRLKNVRCQNQARRKT